MTSIYERDYVTVPNDLAEGFRTQAELDAHIAELQGADEGRGGEPRVREGREAARSDQAAADARARARGDQELTAMRDGWIKAALLEVQEYILMVGKVGRGAA